MDTNPEQPEGKRFRPSEFMRARRPHLFSDTEVVDQPQLDRHTFEYHLETLTNRKQELDFERFARKLCEKEICPNLLPQTGPTGGGDSKVDSETYPVSPDISDLWYYTDVESEHGATERWAFAFSAKEDWKTKVRQDIKNIAATKRPYACVYFVTSRYAKDKDRATIEDELRELYGFDVRILDKTWIVEKVFTNRRERLAIETLHLSIPFVGTQKKGPRDASREVELHEIEEQLKDPERYQGLDYQLVEDALQSALLARGIELPRVGVEGRFARAWRLAQKRGTRQQQLRCAYNKAWTYFWWYDDVESLSDMYDTVESLAKGSTQVHDLELLQNLWQLLNSSVRTGQISLAESRVQKRAEVLKGELARVAGDKSRPSSALHAAASLLLMDVIESYGRPEALQRNLRKFEDIFEKSKGLIDFPALHFAEMLMEIGELLPEDEGYDATFESVLELTRERESSAAAGRMLLRRGSQKLKGQQPYAAIRLLGRAQQDLALHECRGEMVAALGLCAIAYEAVGLLWASRGCILLATSQALREFRERGAVATQAIACVHDMIWLELRLARIPFALAWVELFLVLSNSVRHNEELQEKLKENWAGIDGNLGGLFLRTDIFDLKDLSALPNVLDRFGLYLSWMALLYAMGYEDRLRAEKAIPEKDSPAAVLSFFNKWLGQLGPSEESETPELLDKQTLEFRSHVLGCNVTVTLANNEESLFLAEAILAGIEAFMATSLDSPLVARTPRLRLKITARDFMTEPLAFAVPSGSSRAIEIFHRKETSPEAGNDAVFHRTLVQLLATIAAHIAILPDEGHAYLESLIMDERGLGRALLITGVKTAVRNCLGDRPKLRISDWTPKNDKIEVFPLLRTEPWNHATSTIVQETESFHPTIGIGEPPPELFDTERMKHQDRKIFSLIDMELWNKAEWSGTGFAIPPEPRESVNLILMFKNREAAARIFSEWREELGPQDSEERLRVSIVTGISKDNPAAYRVIISENPKFPGREQREGKQYIIVSRICEMSPETSTNLDGFLQEYRKDKRYLLLPGEIEQDRLGASAPTLGILKQNLTVRPAWQIGRNDPDMVAIHADDKIIIPDGVSDAPVCETLALKKDRQRRSAVASPSGTPPHETSRGKIGRNDPCFCGSGKKYKKCHGR